MIAVSLPQPSASLLVTRQPCRCVEVPIEHWRYEDCAAKRRVSRFVLTDRPRPDLIGQHIAIGSTEDEPGPARQIGEYVVDRDDESWFISRLHEWAIDAEPGQRLPLGHIVGSATVAACYPIKGPGDGTSESCVYHDGNNLRVIRRTTYGAYSWNIERIPDQLPYGDWTPGRYALELVDAAPTTERCPACWGSGCLDPNYVEAPPCRCCRTDLFTHFAPGRCDPIPASGQTGWWEREETGAH